MKISVTHLTQLCAAILQALSFRQAKRVLNLNLDMIMVPRCFVWVTLTMNHSSGAWLVL